MLSREEIFLKLYEALGRALSVPQQSISESTSMDNLKQWDSLRFLLVLHEVEKTFNLSLAAVDMKSLRSVRGLAEAIERMKLSGR